MTCRRGTYRRHHPRAHGAAAILAMMFLVIFGSLAAAMAIVAQGNLSIADAHLKINRSLASAETGMQFVIHKLNEVARDVETRDGIIDSSNAPSLWTETRDLLIDALSGESHNLAEPTMVDLNNPDADTGPTLRIGPIALAPGAPQFTAYFTPHPLAGEDYDSAYYAREPYTGMDPVVSSSAPLDATWIRVRVESSDGPAGRQVTRAVQIDFKMDKKIRFAILSKSRVMIGRNVMIQGSIGSRFLETHLPNGHPVQILSDFVGLDSTFDASIGAFVDKLVDYDMDGDNRLSVGNPSEAAAYDDPASLDINNDGYVDDYDFFLAHYDGRFGGTTDGQITAGELDTANNVVAAQLLEMIDTFGNPARAGYNDGVINNLDRYAKIRGQISIVADKAGWESGAAAGPYQDYFQGPIVADFGEDPLTFEADDANVHSFEPEDFDVSGFRDMTDSDLATQVTSNLATADGSPDDPLAGEQVFEEVPYGSANPYDYFDRPVYENMTFTNVLIPKGTNALFRNCTFIGMTFIETETDNGDANFNYAGIQDATGALVHPDKTASVDGATLADTKTVANNIRFDSCKFEGAVVTDSAPNYTHVRNKLTFTGLTDFDVEGSTNLTANEKELFRRSTLLAPHYSIEFGTFVDPNNPNERIELSGTIVAGILDMRGQVKVNGTVLMTFEPVSDTGPVIGETSPQFNTTLGYFSDDDGDLEADEIPANGLGVIQMTYDETLPLPDGILGPIEIRPIMASYMEGGAQ